MPHIISNVNLLKCWDDFVNNDRPDKTLVAIDELKYDSYSCQRDYGMTHEQCMSIGLGKESYNERYNQENFGA